MRESREKILKKEIELPINEKEREILKKLETENPKEAFLIKSEKVLGKPFNVFLVNLDSGISGIFKPGRGELNRKEKAVYLLSKFLFPQLSLVPPTEIREMEIKIKISGVEETIKEKGSFQLWIPEAQVFSKEKFKGKIPNNIENQLFYLWVLDYIIAHKDRRGNILIDENKSQIYAIDNEESFFERPLEINPEILDKKLPPELLKDLEDFLSERKDEFKKIIEKEELLDQREISAFLQRVEKIVKILKENQGVIPKENAKDLEKIYPKRVQKTLSDF